MFQLRRRRMPDDLRHRLAQAAGSPRRSVDVDAAMRRGTRLRGRRVAGRLAAVTVVSAAIGGMAVTAWPGPSGPSLPAISGTASAGFDPASFADEDGEATEGAWYMSRDGFESRVDDAEAMCRWASRTTDLGARLRPYGGDGLPLVVRDYCGMGHRPEDDSPLPAGTSSAWGEYRIDCSRYAHRWKGQQWEKQTPTEACLEGDLGHNTVPPDEWAYPEAMAEYYPEVYAEHYPTTE